MPTSEVKIHTFYYQFYCNDCKKIFSIPVQKNEEEIPEKHRVRFLELLAEGKRLIWPFDESPSEEKVRKMERERLSTAPMEDGISSSSYGKQAQAAIDALKKLLADKDQRPRPKSGPFYLPSTLLP